jgi:sporulation protein YqfC
MRRKARKIDELLEIPIELSTDNPKITIIGFEKVLIENHKGILEYQDYFIRLNTYIGIININGFNLSLEEMNTDDLIITGKIEGIDFENTINDEEE